MKPRYPKNANKIDESGREDKSGINIITQQLRSQWHKLKENTEGKDITNSMYLVASFNHWFPIKMKSNQEKDSI